MLPEMQKEAVDTAISVSLSFSLTLYPKKKKIIFFSWVCDFYLVFYIWVCAFFFFGGGGGWEIEVLVCENVFLFLVLD